MTTLLRGKWSFLKRKGMAIYKKSLDHGESEWGLAHHNVKSQVRFQGKAYCFKIPDSSVMKA